MWLNSQNLPGTARVKLVEISFYEYYDADFVSLSCAWSNYVKKTSNKLTAHRLAINLLLVGKVKAF